jgi:transcriptional regulator with XRE-family HTH domain
LGVTQRKVAEQLLVNPWTILNWETGRFQPSIRAIPRILSFLGYDPFPTSLDLSGLLRQKRRENGWSIREAAADLGVDPGTWRNWETGNVVLHRRHRLSVAQLLGLDADSVTAEMRARWNGTHRRIDASIRTSDARDRATKDAADRF